MKPAPRHTLSYGLLLWLVLCLFASLACLPIPVKMDALGSPAIDLTIVDKEGAPIEGARVVIYRNEDAPHWKKEPLSTYSATSSEAGEARFDHVMVRKTNYPLMMHGVGWDTWHVCVAREGYQTRVAHLFAQGNAVGRRPDGEVIATWEQIYKGERLEDVHVTLLKLEEGQRPGVCGETLDEPFPWRDEEPGIDIKTVFIPQD